jgi:hypothetical protein
LEVVRISDPVYVDQAAHDFAGYVTKTLSASQRHGGRYNRPGEFGALYTASDFDTALAEITSRYAREGVPGLPEMMGLIRILIRGGRYVDLSDQTFKKLGTLMHGHSPHPHQRPRRWNIVGKSRAQSAPSRISSKRPPHKVTGKTYRSSLTAKLASFSTNYSLRDT